MAKNEIVNMLWSMLEKLLTKINIIIMALLSASISFITALTHKKRTMLQAFIGALLSFLTGMVLGLLASYITNEKAIYMAVAVGSALFSDGIIRYVMTNEDSIIKKIAKLFEKKL